MTAPKRIFGTDGVRGTANIEPVTAETALKLGRAAGHVFKNLGPQARDRVRHRLQQPRKLVHRQQIAVWGQRVAVVVAHGRYATCRFRMVAASCCRVSVGATRSGSADMACRARVLVICSRLFRMLANALSWGVPAST